MKYWGKLATVGTVLSITAGLSGCSSPEHAPPAVAEVALQKGLDADGQARQIETVLNMGKKITGATVEIGYEIPINSTEPPGTDHMVSIANPIKAGPDTYLYADSTEADKGISMVVIHYTGALVVLHYSDEFGPPPTTAPTPTEAIVSLSAVYSQFPTADNKIARYYVISTNQPPGNNYDDVTVAAGTPVWTGP